MPMAEKICGRCGSSSFEEESQGADEFLVCRNCGCVDGTSQQQQFLHVPPLQPHMNREAPLRRHNFDEEDRQTRYRKEKEQKMRSLLRNMCRDLKLPQHETKVCEDEMLALTREGVISNKWKGKEIAAGIVYLACERQYPVSLKKMEDICKVKAKRLNVVVRMLKGKQANLDPTQSSLCGENRLRALLDGFTLHLQPRQKKTVLKTALDIWELLDEAPEGGPHVAQTVAADHAVLALAVEHVKQNKLTPHPQLALSQRLLRRESLLGDETETVRVALPYMYIVRSHLLQEKSETIQLASNVSLTPDSLMTRMCKIRKRVLDIGKTLPEIAAAMSQKKLSQETFASTLPSILRWKGLILADRIKPESLSPELDPSGSGEMAAVGNGEPFHWNGGDSDSDLSDIDVDEYIASKDEVAEREKLYKQL